MRTYVRSIEASKIVAIEEGAITLEDEGRMELPSSWWHGRRKPEVGDYVTGPMGNPTVQRGTAFDAMYTEQQTGEA